MKKLLVLRHSDLSPTAKEALDSLTKAAQGLFSVEVRPSFYGSPDILLLWGVGAPVQAAARETQLARGGRVIMLDMGYQRDPLGRNRMFRISLDAPHPQQWLDQTPSNVLRGHWPLLEEEPVLGQYVLVVGMGPKSNQQYGMRDWAKGKIQELEKSGISRTDMLHRPKPKRPFFPVHGVAHDAISPMASLLRKSRLVVTHHSNAAVEAVIAGVPIDTEDGAAAWLRNKNWTYKNRKSFINRLSHWQYRPSEAGDAWNFLEGFLK